MHFAIRIYSFVILIITWYQYQFHYYFTQDLIQILFVWTECYTFLKYWQNVSTLQFSEMFLVFKDLFKITIRRTKIFSALEFQNRSQLCLVVYEFNENILNSLYFLLLQFLLITFFLFNLFCKFATTGLNQRHPFFSDRASKSCSQHKSLQGLHLISKSALLLSNIEFIP